MKSRIFYCLTISRLFSIFKTVSSDCYFSNDYQGEYLTQVETPLRGGSNLIPRQYYSRISIQLDAIPIWGKCHKKLGQNVILAESGSSDCYRCFHLSLHSSNVIELVTHSLDRCYAKSHLAIQSCPGRQGSSSRASRLLLFRTTNNPNEISNRDYYCPFNGNFDVRQLSNPKESGSSCRRRSTPLSNCPDGNQLNLTFDGCQGDLVLKCLGDWSAGNKTDRFIAFEVEGVQEEDDRPKFLCGLYTEDPSSQHGILSLSRDSSCSSIGQDVFEFSRRPSSKLPSIVRKSSCSFPNYTQDAWEDLRIGAGHLVYREKYTYRTVTADCIQKSFRHKDRFLIYSRTNCGEEYYNCIWFESRSPNIIEFQFGMKLSTIPSLELCENSKFLQRTWITQAKENPLEQSSCPIAGQYNSVLPESSQLCAKIVSDCNNLNTVYFSVTECINTSDILEDREYECLGQWEENNMLFTYTRRKDLQTLECFVGTTDDDGQLYLIESGPHCKRGLAVTQYGMELHKTSNCKGISFHSAYGKPWFVPDSKLPKPFDSINADDISTNSWQPMTGEQPFRSSCQTIEPDTKFIVATIWIPIIFLWKN